GPGRHAPLDLRLLASRRRPDHRTLPPTPGTRPRRPQPNGLRILRTGAGGGTMRMDPNKLWAKSIPRDGKETPSMLLSGHLAESYEAAKRVLDATGNEQLRALGLAPEQYRDRFRRIVFLAAAVHDLGKANDHFQGMIRSERWDVPQGLRHEWVTLLILKS